MTRAHVGDAAHDRRQRGEWRVDLLGEESGQRRLAGTRRTPQHHRRQVAALDHPPQRAALADEVLLPDELVERARPHPRREWRVRSRARQVEGACCRGWCGVLERDGICPEIIPRRCGRRATISPCPTL